MPNRVYLLIALAFMIGGPLTVMAISDALPKDESAQAAPDSQPEAPPAVEVEPEPEPEPETPPPARSEAIDPTSTDPLFDASPTMDADAVAVQIPGDSPPPPPPATRETQRPESRIIVGPDDIDPSQHR